MRIQFKSVCVQTRLLKKKDRIDMSPGFSATTAIDYFHSYLNQTPELLGHGSYNLRIEKD